jgi:hypothetical protein
MTKESRILIRELERLGYRCSLEGPHLKVRNAAGGLLATFSQNLGKYRNEENTRAQLRRAGLLPR